MAGLSYLLDTNAVSDYLNGITTTTQRINQAILERRIVYLAEPVYYEVLRGALKTNAIRKLREFESRFAPQLDEVMLIRADWQQAAQFWADSTRIGKQLSDVDLLIAALAARLNAIIVSADTDFDILPVKRENWRAS